MFVDYGFHLFGICARVIWEVNFVMLESTQIVCVDEGRRLFELVKDEVVIDECQNHLETAKINV